MPTMPLPCQPPVESLMNLPWHQTSFPVRGLMGSFLGFFFPSRHYVWVGSSSVTTAPCKFDLGDSEGRSWLVAVPLPEVSSPAAPARATMATSLGEAATRW